MNGRQATFLDITRTIAAQSVLVGHVYTTLIGELPVMLGNFGVLLFFVLSGFLICYSVLEKRDKNAAYGMRLFFYDRSFRIFVAFAPALLLVLVLDYAVISHRGTYEYEKYFTVKNFVGTLLMLAQNPLGLVAEQLLRLPELKISTFGSARPFWTVIVEWWLYLFFGWMVLRAGLARRSPWLFMLVLLLLGIVPLFNAVAGTGEGLTIIWFAAAGLAWTWYRFRSSIRHGVERANAHGYLGVLAFGLLVTAAGLLVTRMFWVSFVQAGFKWRAFSFYDVTFGLLLLLGFFVVILWLERGNGGKRSSVAKFFSDYTYSLYLVHYSLIVFLVSFGLRFDSTLLSSLAYFVVCNLAGVLFWALFERHYPALKNSWIKYRSG